MDRKHFQRDYDIDSVSVDFVIEYHNNQSVITTIQLNTSKKLLPLPQRPTLEAREGKWVLCENSIEKIDSNDTVILTPVINKYTTDIVNEMLRLKDEATPKFFN